MTVRNSFNGSSHSTKLGSKWPLEITLAPKMDIEELDFIKNFVFGHPAECSPFIQRKNGPLKC